MIDLSNRATERDDMIRALRGLINQCDSLRFNLPQISVDTVKDIVLLLESEGGDVTPELANEATPRRGTCKDLGGTGGYSHSDFACSECGCTIAVREYFACVPTMFLADGSIAKPRYCPNCGRKVV